MTAPKRGKTGTIREVECKVCCDNSDVLEYRCPSCGRQPTEDN